MKILVIDTNKDMEIIYKRKLKNISSNIEFINNIKKVENKVSENKYDLIIVSHTLKSYTGQEVYDILRSIGYKGPVIIAAAGRNIQSLRPQYNGIVGLVNKELNTKEFIINILELARAA